jgi:uncharacterized membrane protein
MPEGLAPNILIDRRGAETWVWVTVEIQRPAEEVFHFWRNPVNLTRFFGRLQAVEPLGGDWSRWIVGSGDAPAATWSVRQSVERADELLGWRAATEDGGTPFATLRCVPLTDRQGTLIEWALLVRPGSPAEALLDGEPETAVRADVARFVDLMRSRDGD